MWNDSTTTVVHGLLYKPWTTVVAWTLHIPRLVLYGHTYCSSDGSLAATYVTVGLSVCLSVRPVLDKYQLTPTDPHDAASRSIDHHTVHSCRRSDINRRQSFVDGRQHLVTFAVVSSVVNNDCCLFISHLTIVDMYWPDFLSSEFGTNFQSKVP